MPFFSSFKGYYWVAISLLLVTLAQLSMKLAMVMLPTLSFSALTTVDFVQLSQWVADNCPAVIYLLVGIIGYLLSMICWFMALHYLPLNRAYPLLGLSYVLVYIVASHLPMLQENSSIIKTIGTLFILIGVFLVSSEKK